MFRFFVSISFGVLFLNELAFAVPIPNENKDNVPNRTIPKPDLPPNDSRPLKKHKTASPQKLSPISQERRYWSPIRRGMAGLKSTVRKKNRRAPISSPMVRRVYKQQDPGDFFVQTSFDNKVVLQADQLFDTHALVLSKKGKWESNLSRMERGLSPIGHRGISDRYQDEFCTQEEVRKKQKEWRIDLQHVTQKDTGSQDDPICEMTHTAHLGLNARMLLQIDEGTKSPLIVYSSLEKEEALTFSQEDPSLVMVTNLLHFRSGGSLVDRSEFGKWRKSYWKWRAEQIKCRTNLQPSPSTSKIFPSPRKLSSEPLLFLEEEPMSMLLCEE